MRFHIVRNNDTVERILALYNLSKSELLKENKHITAWDKLIPGTKLRIPPITESTEQTIKDIEPFVEDYYPKLKSFPNPNETELSTSQIQESNLAESTLEEKTEEEQQSPNENLETVDADQEVEIDISKIPELQDKFASEETIETENYSNEYYYPQHYIASIPTYPYYVRVYWTPVNNKE